MHAHSVLHQLRAGLQIDGRIVVKPHGVLLIGNQTQGTEDVTGAIGIRAGDDGGGVVGGRIIALNHIRPMGGRREDVVHLARRDVGALALINADLLAQERRLVRREVRQAVHERPIAAEHVAAGGV